MRVATLAFAWTVCASCATPEASWAPVRSSTAPAPAPAQAAPATADVELACWRQTSVFKEDEGCLSSCVFGDTNVQERVTLCVRRADVDDAVAQFQRRAHGDVAHAGVRVPARIDLFRREEGFTTRRQWSVCSPDGESFEDRFQRFRLQPALEALEALGDGHQSHVTLLVEGDALRIEVDEHIPVVFGSSDPFFGGEASLDSRVSLRVAKTARVPLRLMTTSMGDVGCPGRALAHALAEARKRR